MRKMSILLLVLLLCISVATPAFAEVVVPKVVDQADLLSNSEEAALRGKLDEISSRHGMDVVVVTTDTLEGKTPMAYADDFYDDSGYSEDGVVLLVSMEDSDWWISTAGYGITVFTDAGIEYLGEQFVPYLSDGDFVAAFDAYAQECDRFITRAKTGDPFDSHNLPKEPFSFFFTLVVCLIIGFVFALIVTGIMRSSLKSVRFQSGASDYVKAGSLKVTHRQDLFLYRDVKRTPKPQSSSGSSTHTASSGRSHGGGGGKF